MVTGIFSFLVWRASEESANVARSTYELTIEIRKQQEQKENQLLSSLQIEHLKTALKNVSNVYYFLAKLEKRQVSSDNFNEVPEDCGVREIDMAQFIDGDIKNDIHEAWIRFDAFIDTYWKGTAGYNSPGTFNHTQDARSEKKANEQLIDVFYNLKTTIENKILNIQHNQPNHERLYMNFAYSWEYD